MGRLSSTEPDAVCTSIVVACELRSAALERAGRSIGNHDLLIAAHARSRGMTLVTHDMREFERVPGLRVEDWLTALP